LKYILARGTSRSCETFAATTSSSSQRQQAAPGTCLELQGCFTAILWFCLFMSSPADAVIQSKLFPAAATDYCRLQVAETSKFLPLINIRKLLH
jgi:hypothetical protein